MSTQTRRAFLASSAVAATVRAQGRAALTPKEFQAALRGPILSFPTVFQRDGSLDRAAIRRMIDGAIEAGVRVVALTRGNSQYDWLSYQEIEDLTRWTVDAAKGRAITIAATSAWWTSRAAAYGEFAAKVGADAVQVFVPTEGSEASLTAHVRAVAQAARRPIVIHGQPSPGVLRSLMSIEEVAAIKEEFTLPYSVPLMTEFAGRLTWFAGGTKARFLAYRPLGMNAYYTTLMTFAPQVAMGFWKAVQAGREADATEIIAKYEVPFFNKWSFPFWVATLEHFGIAQRHLRAPREALTDKQMQDLAAFYDKLGLRKS